MKFEIILATTGSAALAAVAGASMVTNGAAAFAPAPPRLLTRSSSSRTLCLAKVTRKGGKRVSSSSGTGFGTSSSSNKNKSDKNTMSSKLRSVPGQHTGLGNKILRKAANLFDAIRKEHDKEACNDVYIRSPLNSPTTYWYVGKVAAVPGQATGRDACLAQKRIILEYAKTKLRPQNLGGKYASHLELWVAPGDSEMDVVTNKVSLEKVTGSAADLSDDFNVNSVGYNPEIYVGDEVTKGGLRVERDEEGRPTKPVFEVNESV